MQNKLKVDMHCASCVNTITKKLKKAGVKAEVNIALKICKIDYDDNKISLDEIQKKLNSMGYDSEEI